MNDFCGNLFISIKNYCEGVGRADKGVSFRRLTNMKRAIQEEEIGVPTLGRQYIHAQLTPSVSLHQGEKGRRSDAGKGEIRNLYA